MITYETYCKILQMRQDQLRVAQISSTLGLDERTVVRWIEAGGYRQRESVPRTSKLDPYKVKIVDLNIPIIPARCCSSAGPPASNAC